jgi:cyclic pyranopterin phosphate synthase
MGDGPGQACAGRQNFLKRKTGLREPPRHAKSISAVHTSMKKLTHFGKGAEVAMVDVTAKAITQRTALAHGFVRIGDETLAQIRSRKTPKGDPLEIARIAGIAAAKRTSDWIPLCHPLPLTHIDVTARLCQNGVELTSRVTTTAQTGVEMEALVGVSAAALTIYDMCKALDKSIEISDIYLVEKTGGKSGPYRRGAVNVPRARKPVTSSRLRSKK